MNAMGESWPRTVGVAICLCQWLGAMKADAESCADACLNVYLVKTGSGGLLSCAFQAFQVQIS